MHGMNANAQYLSKAKSLENEISLLKYEKESLQEHCTRHFIKCKSLKDAN